MREIIEADIVQTDGDVLYALNRYRGLLLVDMSDPDAPFVKGRVPFQAQPVDMYLRDHRAYVVVSDYFNYWQFDDDADPFGFHGSQVLVVDVSDTASPSVTGTFNVDGEVTDTRIVGDVLYAVSKRNPEYWRYDTYEWKDTTWVMSINIADPAHIAEVDRKEFSGSANLIQVYENALSIAAIDPNYYLVDDANLQQTLVTYVDISDPKGNIVVGDGARIGSGSVVVKPVPPAATVVANISVDAVRSLPRRIDAETVITSGYFLSEQPDLQGYEHVDRRVLDQWAADVHRRR
jgi:hypothetical protein